MNSINWPALHVWVLIAQLVEHCSANAKATGSNPFDYPRKLFFRLIRIFSTLSLSMFNLFQLEPYGKNQTSHLIHIYFQTAVGVGVGVKGMHRHLMTPA